MTLVPQTRMAQLVRSHLQCRRPRFCPWVGKSPWRRERLPTPVFRPGEFHGLYSPWGHKESDTTERLSLSVPEKCIRFYNKPHEAPLQPGSALLLERYCSRLALGKGSPSSSPSPTQESKMLGSFQASPSTALSELF